MRPQREHIHLATAVMWSSRSLCSRLKVGAVITDEDMRRVLAIGYNGPARHLPHDLCTGTLGACGCLHAEDNAIAVVDSTVPRKRLFLTHNSCTQCAQRVINSGFIEVMYLWPYRDDGGKALLESAGIKVVRADPFDLVPLVGKLLDTRIRQEE